MLFPVVLLIRPIIKDESNHWRQANNETMLMETTKQLGSGSWELMFKDTEMYHYPEWIFPLIGLDDMLPVFYLFIYF